MKKLFMVTALALLVLAAGSVLIYAAQANSPESEDEAIEKLLSALPSHLNEPLNEDIQTLADELYALRKSGKLNMSLGYAKKFEAEDLAKRDGAVLLLGTLGPVVKEIPVADIHTFETEIDGQKKTVLLQLCMDIPLKPGETALVAAVWAEGRYIADFGPSGVFTGIESELSALQSKLCGQ